MQREFYEPQQAAELLHCSEAWLLTRATVGEFPHLAWGKGEIVFTDEHLEEITHLREIRQDAAVTSNHGATRTTPTQNPKTAPSNVATSKTIGTTAISTSELPIADWLSPKDICAQLHIPEQTFYQWRVKSLGPRAYRIGRHLRISRSDYEAWLSLRLER